MTERKSLESERAELVALADEIETSDGLVAMTGSAPRQLGFRKSAKVVDALRRLAAQDQKPCDGCDGHECLDKNQQYECQYPGALPDHGGADAGVGEVLRRVVAELEAMRTLCALMIFEPDHGKPHPLKDGVYDQRMLAAYDAINAGNAALSHQPAPVAANASAEARLREALEIARKVRYTATLLAEGHPKNSPEHLGWRHHSDGADEVAYKIDEALFTHPHASDCDKQGER